MVMHKITKRAAIENYIDNHFPIINIIFFPISLVIFIIGAILNFIKNMTIGTVEFHLIRSDCEQERTRYLVILRKGFGGIIVPCVPQYIINETYENLKNCKKREFIINWDNDYDKYIYTLKGIQKLIFTYKIKKIAYKYKE